MKCTVNRNDSTDSYNDDAYSESAQLLGAAPCRVQLPYLIKEGTSHHTHNNNSNQENQRNILIERREKSAKENRFFCHQPYRYENEENYNKICIDNDVENRNNKNDSNFSGNFNEKKDDNREENDRKNKIKFIKFRFDSFDRNSDENDGEFREKKRGKYCRKVENANEDYHKLNRNKWKNNVTEESDENNTSSHLKVNLLSQKNDNNGENGAEIRNSDKKNGECIKNNNKTDKINDRNDVDYRNENRKKTIFSYKDPNYFALRCDSSSFEIDETVNESKNGNNNNCAKNRYKSDSQFTYDNSSTDNSKKKNSFEVEYGDSNKGITIRENPFDCIEKDSGQAQIRSEKKRELSRLRKLYYQRKLSLVKSKQGSLSSEFTETSTDEMDKERKQSFKEIMFSKKMRKRAFWFIVIFLAALTIRDVVNLIIEYSGNPKQSDMNIHFNESMTMPNITFCMSRAQAWSHFRLNANETPAAFDIEVDAQLANMTDRSAFLSSPWEMRMVMETYNLIASLTSMERETTVEGAANTIQKFSTQDRYKEVRKTLKKWLEILNNRGVSFEEFTQKVGRETLRRSLQRFTRTTYNENDVIKTGVHVTWISQMQFCFQPSFDADNFKPIEDQGNFFVMILSHNAEKLDKQQVECMSVDFHGRASTNSRLTGSKGQAKDGFNDELCVGGTHSAIVEVKARYKMLPNDEEGTACRDHDDGEDNEYDCHARCRMEFVRSLCECTPPTLSYLADDSVLQTYPLCDYTKCKINVQTSNYSNEQCTKKCYRDCDQIRYELDHEEKGKNIRADLTIISLDWGSFEYLTLEQDWVWSVSSFIAALGGSIGMWLGLSILSLIQGGTYAYTYLTQNVIHKKKRSRAVSTSSKPNARKESENPRLNSNNVEIPDITTTSSDSPVNTDPIPIVTNPLKNPFKGKIGNQHKSPPPEYS